ncbi:MAG: hypothetical protein DA408_13075 [Bacteroidetes bacterium]|nr:MAG: hypothetical protein C7N36_11400 [Bacteroidota bacterium]PTM11647.1 MAG: hypothetical protein DA408_13075 [Bacteroidota bacterium]
MRVFQLFFVAFLGVFSLTGQNAGNPFELTPRLGAEAAAVTAPATNPTATPGNPFDLQPRLQPGVEHTPAIGADNPEVEITSKNPAAELPVEGAPLPTPIQGTLLLITLGLLTVATLTLIFFRSLYAKAYRGLFNDNLLTQLYREREAGAIGSFIITYIVFFLSAGLFIILTLQHFGHAPRGSFWRQYVSTTLAIMVLFVAKHLVLALMGYIFPVAKEARRYSFTIMAFAMVLGLFLTGGSVLLAYAPPEWHRWVIYGVAGLVVATYVLRSLRGLFIANRFIFNYLFHFLSYICAVEIGPALCLYKLLTTY